MWAPIAAAFAWVHQAAIILKNEVELDSQGVQARLRGLLGAITRWKSLAGNLEPGVDHFLKVTRSYWAGLFHCYHIPGLPKTNNDLEHVFGKWRHHQRRCTGRKVAPSTAVTRGSVQLIAALATQLRSYSAAELATVSQAQWQHLRSQLQHHQQKRIQQRHFRRSPATYLADLEQKLLQLALLS